MGTGAADDVAPAAGRGAKLGADDARNIRTELTPGLQQVFGMAEGLLNYTRLGDPADIVDNTQGRPLSEHDELRVVDENGSEVAPGEEGELLVRGPYTLNGYFNAERDNERSFSPDGFYRTGDKVRRFADGYLEVTGRVKDVIHRGGETVSALDLEEHLLAHPSIWAAAAVPLPDEYLGEKICAAVVFSGAPVTLPETERIPGRTWRRRPFSSGRAGADVDPANHGGRQGGQEGDRQGAR